MAIQRPRPSSLPMVQKCACFEPSGSDDADAGNERHEYLAALWDCHRNPLSAMASNLRDELQVQLSEEEVDGVRWAFDYIISHAQLREFEPDWEHRLLFVDDNFREVYGGTPDVVCANEIFDLKWRERDYLPQMADYALMLLNDHDYDTVRVHILYGQSKCKEVFTLTTAQAKAIVDPIIARAIAPDRKPEPNEYCGWCSQRVTCPAVNERVQAVAAGREDWKLEQYHTSEITRPEEMAKALNLARLIKKWAEAVEFHAKEMATKQGMSLPGWELKTKAASQFCADLGRAYELSGLAPAEFLSACSLRLNTPKKHPERTGLVEAVQKKLKLSSKAAAKRYVEKALAEVLKRGNPVQELRRVNVVDDEDDSPAIDV
jgi:hypothetical protein